MGASTRPRAPASPAPSSASSTRTPTPCGRWTSKRAGPAAPGRCHPLTILDDHSRYALGLAACPNQRTATVRAHLVTAFERYGLPDRVLVDNGSPWGNHPAHPYTPLTVWLRRLGIAVSHSRPYHPETLGKDERFHGTLERELGRQPPRPDLDAWQTAFDAWRHEYNHVRPHDSLDLAVPASRYHVSPRPYPAELPPLPYGPEDQHPSRPGRRLGVIPGAADPATQGPARAARGLPPHRHGRSLDHPLSDRTPWTSWTCGIRPKCVNDVSGSPVNHLARSKHPSRERGPDPPPKLCWRGCSRVLSNESAPNLRSKLHGRGYADASSRENGQDCGKSAGVRSARPT